MKDRFGWKKAVVKPERTREQGVIKKLKKMTEVKPSEHSFSEETVEHKEQFFSNRKKK